VEPDQVYVFALTVLRNPEEVDHALEARLSRQLRSDVREPNWQDRIDLDLTFFHPVAIANLDVGAHPYSDAARDSSATDSVAQTLSEDHS
jgi:hypothetical protein